MSSPVELVPNPHFVFPMRAEEPPRSESPALMNPTSRPVSLPPARRGVGAGSGQRRSASALPAFSFNPSGSSTSTHTTTPPDSPLPPTMPVTPSRAVGHRRGGSEFIGGDGKAGGAGLRSSSPTKGEGVLPAPTSEVIFGPPAGRRGHAHRRSGAVSCHDLSSILQPKDANTRTQAGSAPVTPLKDEVKPLLSTNLDQGAPPSSLRRHSAEESGLFRSDSDSSPTRRPFSRARVGFSDRIEYIRPLSTISSETESSISTLRGHSVSGSLSSVISSGAASPPPSRMTRPSLNTTLEDGNGRRPNTAGAILDGIAARHSFGELSAAPKRPMSAMATSPNPSGSTGSPVSPHIKTKRRAIFGFENRRSEPTLPATEATFSTSPPRSPLVSDEAATTDIGKIESDEEQSTSKRKPNSKPPKVMSWANSLISRRSWSHGARVKPAVPLEPEPVSHDRIPSPALASPAPDDGSVFGNFDVDDTVTIVSTPANVASQSKLQTNLAPWRPKERTYSDSDADALSPTIDLDAAMGPFDSSSLGSGASPRLRGRDFAVARRTMHSASGFAGFQTHRRSESAPALVPFQFMPAAMASNTSMPDVFEEDEEEESVPKMGSASSSPSAKSTGADDEEEQRMGVQVVEADSAKNGRAMDWSFDNGLGIQRPKLERQVSPMSKVDQAAVQDSVGTPSLDPTQAVVPRGTSPVEVVDDDEEPRTYSRARSSDSSATPTLLSEELKEPPPLMIHQLPVPHQSFGTPDTITTSSFSSPKFSVSQTSLDTPRLGTAASSVAENRHHSLLAGEPGPDMRISVDDVPSLTSSRSTMTSAMQNPFTTCAPRFPGGRSESVTSLPRAESTERRTKRSSIASLSRLMGGSFSERSKLSIEHTAQTESARPMTAPKPKTARRLSKMMLFWKRKEST